MAAFAILMLVGALILCLPSAIPTVKHSKRYSVLAYVAGVLVLIAGFVGTSFVNIGKDEIGLKHRVYFGNTLPSGRIIAVNDEKGPQADILGPGFQIIPFINLTHNVARTAVVNIPEGQYGYLVAKDGAPLRPDQTYADAFDPENAHQMVTDARFFLTERGQRGPQTTVLAPADYRLNTYLWDVSVFGATEIPIGFVGVVKSNVHTRVDFGPLKTEKPENCEPTRAETEGGDDLAVPLVPVGCIGVWDKALNPGKYYVNQQAFQVTLVETRVQTWEYKGGYTRRSISLTVDQEGQITQQPSSEEVPVPASAADPAVYVKVEGWDVPLELRALVQVTPENAPFVVASVGGLEEIEDRVLTPSIRSIVRNVAGGTIDAPAPVLDSDGNPVLDENGQPRLVRGTRPTRVLDLIENREVLEQNVEFKIRVEGEKAGVEIKEIRFGEPAIPPELLVARQREQLAQQLKKAYAEEQEAQGERIKTEQSRATADQQDNLVQAQIEVQRSEQLMQARRNEGQGERDKLKLIAEGQEEQVNVLGEDRVVDLRKYEILLDRVFTFAGEHPEVLEAALANAHKFVPERVFTLGGDGGGSALNLPVAAGILGDFLSPPSAPTTPE